MLADDLLTLVDGENGAQHPLAFCAGLAKIEARHSLDMMLNPVENWNSTSVHLNFAEDFAGKVLVRGISLFPLNDLAR